MLGVLTLDLHPQPHECASLVPSLSDVNKGARLHSLIVDRNDENSRGFIVREKGLRGIYRALFPLAPPPPP